MDRYDAMRVFARIVERRSFTHAAEDLGLPRSSVTDAMKELETRLGVRLLQRTTRRVSPTLDGEAYYQRCLRLVADLEDAERRLCRRQGPRPAARERPPDIGEPLRRAAPAGVPVRVS